MICKELDEFKPRNALEWFGKKAEEKIAFYLKRNFFDHQDLHVINNLRFQALDGTFAQIDHLVLSRYFAVIIESKSVSAAVKCERDGQWLRLWNNHWTGMPSPIQQAKNQSIALKRLLQENRSSLRSKCLFGLRQRGFSDMPIHLLVAVSNEGRIAHGFEPKGFSDVVMKADMVADKILALLAHAKKAASILSKEELPWIMSEEDLRKTTAFLLTRHEPLSHSHDSSDQPPSAEPPSSFDAPPPQEQAPRSSAGRVMQKIPHPHASPPPPNRGTFIASSSRASAPVSSSLPPSSSAGKSAEKKITTLKACPTCGGRVSILWNSKYRNYHWNCCSCGRNFPISFDCPKCGGKLRIRKQGNQYWIYCQPCDLSALYFTDPSARNGS